MSKKNISCRNAGEISRKSLSSFEMNKISSGSERSQTEQHFRLPFVGVSVLKNAFQKATWWRSQKDNRIVKRIKLKDILISLRVSEKCSARKRIICLKTLNILLLSERKSGIILKVLNRNIRRVLKCDLKISRSYLTVLFCRINRYEIHENSLFVCLFLIHPHFEQFRFLT